MSAQSKAVENGELDCLHKAVFSINIRYIGRTQDCAATYIGQGWVLTAAHCVASKCVDGDCVPYKLNMRVGDGIYYPSDTIIHPHANSGFGAWSSDLAVIRLDLSGGPGVPFEERSGDQRIWPMRIATASEFPADASSHGRYLDGIGFSTGSRQRGLLTVDSFLYGGEMRLVGISNTPVGDGGIVDAGSPIRIDEGDSGGPALLVRSGTRAGYDAPIVGVAVSVNHGSAGYMNVASGKYHTGESFREWINTACEGCLNAYQPPPPDYYTSGDYIDRGREECENLNHDPDGDGLKTWEDNCPTKPNADQANCNGENDLVLYGKYVGDACDPTPCAYLTSITPINSNMGGHFYQTWSEARIQHRGVEAHGSSQAVKRSLHSRFCACHKASSSSSGNPDIESNPNQCKLLCPEDGLKHWNETHFRGWQYTMWQLDDPDSGGCQTKAESGGTGPYDDHICDQPLPQRSFQQIYTNGEGQHKGDNAKYWLSYGRTQRYRWRWHDQIYPHNSALDPTYDVNANDTALVKVWLHPEGAPPKRNDTYSPTQFLQSRLRPTDFVALTPWDMLFERFILAGPVDPPPFFPGSDDVGPWVLRPLLATRPSGGVEHLLWADPPGSSATKGIAMIRYNPAAGTFGAVLPSRQAVGSTALTTVDFAAAQLNGRVYVFGGVDGQGQRSSRLWRGEVGQDGAGDTAFFWHDINEEGPPARQGAILVADAPQNRLLLLYGQTDSGVVNDGYVYDVASNSWQSWSPVSEIYGGGARAHAGYAVANGKLLFYGGENNEGELAGLFRVDLASGEGSILEAYEEGPGERAEAAVYYEAATRSVLVFGGRREGIYYNDLWRFSLDSHSWTLVDDGSGGAAPAAMAGAVIVSSPVDGSISVLAGSGQNHTIGWMREPAGWRSYQQRLATP